MPVEQAIGIFDSGVGGLSVLAHIQEQLSNEKLLYVADSAYIPYGCKSETVIRQRCMEISAFLLHRQCKALVVACNTATAAAIYQLRDSFPVPVIGMEPAVKPAVSCSKSKVIGVLATSATSSSDKFNRLAERFSQHARLIVQPCPGLVEQIETGYLSGDEMRSMLTSFLQPLIHQGIDTLVLGCTHYPFVTALIREIIGAEVHIIDAGSAIARELQRQLRNRRLLSDNKAASIEFWSSGDPKAVTPVISRLWGEKVMVKKLPF